MVTRDSMYLLAFAAALEAEIADLPLDVPEGTVRVALSKTLAVELIAAIRHRDAC